ncbi:unnamed protein product [Rotaria sp. Silwood2]|nr:unnamed protein product [Rotaria sp. Silwood2]CAF2861742.1 unnamed protein product [Rotaria sp. Silwood2]CAF3330879.1 unnamed protein product [Rotaria sp. Silwood2]CAF3983810.1 unnamed protein product [Rotaria sp. Silwood2]CAF4093681.1 unnamed protein product [Rotaria sp. Silwood2]
MSKNDDSTVQESFKKKPILLPRGQVKERFVIINHDWFIPVSYLRRLTSNTVENELESIVFPYDESYDSDWQLYIEHQSHPSRIRIGLTLLEPHDRCIHADIKLVFMTTHGDQIIKENFFHKHTFFLAKGEPITSYINEHISPKVFFDIEDDLYDNVINGTLNGNLFNTNDCTIIAYVRFINEFDIEPKPNAFDFSRRFTVDWKLIKFRHIIEQINQSRPPVGNNRRLLSDRFQFTHSKITDALATKKWKLQINYSRTSSINKQTPLCLTLKSLNPIQPNYGKFEILCQNEHNILRRYIESIEDLTDNYTIEFFTLNELSRNIYPYKQNFDKNNGRVVTIDYLLLSIQIVQPLQGFDILKKIKRINEPIIISLNPTGKVRNKKEENLLKSTKEQHNKSIAIEHKKLKSPASQENTTTTSDDTRITNHILPPIRIQNNSPIRLRSSSSIQILPNISDNHIQSSRSFLYKPIRLNKQSSTITSASTTAFSDLTDNFTFLTNLFRSGLHSDITIRHHDHQWNLHKSILSARSIYFNQYFSNSNVLELNLSDDNEILSSILLDKMFFFLYTNQYTLEKLPRLSLFETTRLLFELSNKYGIDTLTRFCLQDMCNTHNLNINTAAYLLIALHQAINGPYEKYHSNDYIIQIKNFKQTILRFIQLHSREVLLSSQWKLLEKHYPFLVHDVLEFVVFEKIQE